MWAVVALAREVLEAYRLAYGEGHREARFVASRVAQLESRMREP